ncbi:MAG TPA: polysaccharide biosynthesis C-terminal domain-containing protein [Bacteroidales bacterium]|nr:polysaccharide biosynthesis C-terminal domain-containing protein [Bacteroidales bacterium]
MYSVSVSIIESIWLISRSISSVQHARIVNTRDFSANTQLTIQFIKIGSFLTCIAIVVLLLVPNSLYIFIFGNEFFEVKSIIVVLSPGVAFFGTSFMISGLFSGIGKQYINSIAAITGLIATIAGAYITIPIWGIYGAAATATIAYTATTVVKLVYFKQQAHISWNSFLITKQDIAYGKQEIIARLSKYGLYR